MAKVLIVDDNADQAASLGKLLKVFGHDVTTSANGQNALVQVIDNRPDVVLLDLFMPEMDGPTFLEVVRSYLRLKTLPVVVLSGIEDSPMADRTKKLGVSCILAKGKARIEDIEKAIEEALKGRSG